MFHKPKLRFMGLVLAQQRVGPTEEKFKAVNEAREPQAVSEVKSFLGLVKFIAWFIPDLATVAEPFRWVAKMGEPFILGLEQQVAFADLRRRLAQAHTLGYFDRTAGTNIITDTSLVGLGVVLLHEQKGKKPCDKLCKQRTFRRRTAVFAS